MDTNENAKEMVAAIWQGMQQKGMRPTDLAQAVGTTDATISRLLNRKTKPRPQLLEAIARELGLDLASLLRMAGLPAPGQKGPLDPGAAYLAQKITELPPHLREKAIDAAGAVVDAFSELVREVEPNVDDALIERVMQAEPETHQRILDELAEQRARRARNKERGE